MQKFNLFRMIRENPVYIKSGLIAALALLLFVGIYISDNSRNVETDKNGNQILKRDESGKDTMRKMKVKIGENEREENIDIFISGKKLSSEEIREQFEKAGKVLEKAILGKNQSLDEVRSDLDLITNVPDSQIKVTWESDNYNVINILGVLNEEATVEEGTLVKLTAVMSYEDESASHEFYIKIFPPLLTEDEKKVKNLRDHVEKKDQDTKSDEYLVLPDKIDGEKVIWNYSANSRAFAVLVMGAGVSCMLIVSKNQRKKEKEKKKIHQMKIDYPQIINKFNLYIRAGMTVRKAWFQIVNDYEKKEKKNGERSAYEEMRHTMYQIQSGYPEGECYENFGTRCKISDYRKFGTMLSQNLQKGSKGLTDLLEREAVEAFEERKNLAKKVGEEAGTKLMIPLFMMLAVVFAVVMVPAFFSIQI